jgi:hypothetical protein
MMLAFSAALLIFLRHSARAWYSLGCGGYPHLFGATHAPASRRISVSEVSMYVHMDLTPRLSSARGVTLISCVTFVPLDCICSDIFMLGRHLILFGGR